MSIHRNPDGTVTVRWREHGRGSRQRQRTFRPPLTPGQPTALAQARAFSDELARRKRLGGVVDLDRGKTTLAEFVETYWRLHAIPNLSAGARAVYAQTWAKHLHGRVGDRELRELTPGHVNRLRADLERVANPPTVHKALTVLQSILAFAVLEGHVDRNPAQGVKKPRVERQRTPYVFAPADVEAIRGHLDVLSASLVSVLAYAGPRPEEALRLRVRDVGALAVRFDGQKTRRERHTPLLAPLAADLRELHLATGRRGPNAPVFPAHDGGHWQPDDYRNWRRRVWQAVAPAGTRPRDLRGSYVTLRAYEGVPLTTIAREVGCSVVMLDRHYAGTLANWDGRQVAAEEQIRQARGGLRILRREAL
jgi:integrase